MRKRGITLKVRVNETGRVYFDDLEEISRKQEELWSNTKKIIDMLSRMS